MKRLFLEIEIQKRTLHIDKENYKMVQQEQHFW